MNKPKFYQAVLNPLSEEELNYTYLEGQTLNDRLGSDEGYCPECGENQWWILPIESRAVKEGGKFYCECLECGYVTHL